MGLRDFGAEPTPLARAATRLDEQAIEVVQQAFERIRGLLLIQLTLNLQVQPRIFDQTLANRRRRIAPGGIERGDLATTKPLLGDHFTEPLTGL